MEKKLTAEQIIQDVLGIKPGASRLTPTDYEETKMCMQEFASQELTEYKTKLKEQVLSMLPIYANGERYNGAKYMSERVIELIDSL